MWLIVGVLLFLARDTRITETVIAEVPAQPTTSPAPVNTPPPEPVLDVKDDERYGETLEDDDGNVVGHIEVLLLADEDVWVEGSETQIEQVGDIFQKGKDAFSESLMRDIQESPEIVNLGAADFRGRRLREEDRADARGRNLKKVITRDITQRGGTVHYVELGQWVPTLDPRCQEVPRAAQRRIVIVRVLSRDENVPLGPALRKALSKLQNKHEVFKDVLTCYSKSSVFRLR
jgi:hypothetical protein